MFYEKVADGRLIHIYGLIPLHTYMKGLETIRRVWFSLFISCTIAV